MLHLGKALALTFCVLLLTGCPTPPKAPARTAAMARMARQYPEEHPPAPPGQPEQEPELPPVQTELPLDRWVSWAAWTQANGCDMPPQTKLPTPLYEVRNGHGALAITIGSRVAYWNGLALGLGFGPRLTNGEPFIHMLDAVKNFEPLIRHPQAGPKRPRIVVIDPGHGGDNTGARSILNHELEKDYTLDWALRAQPLLISNGWQVFLTRTLDVHLSLSNRVAFADSVGADLFISLHFNANGPGPARVDHGGIETYCLTPAGMPSNLTRDFQDDPALVFPNNAFDVENLQFAIRLHRSLIELTGRKDRGVRRARFMTVLQGQSRPAVLLEGGYLSDREEARLIATAAYRQKLAQAVAVALGDNHPVP